MEVQGFTSRKQFTAWANAGPCAGPIKRAEELVATASKTWQGKEQDSIAASQKLTQDYTAKRIEQLAARLGMDATNPELLRQATRKLNPFEEPPLGTIILYRDPGCSGQAVFLGKTVYPNFAWFGFANAASSYRVWNGLMILFDKPGTIGNRYWDLWYAMPGMGGSASQVLWIEADLAQFGWDDRAKSAIHFG